MADAIERAIRYTGSLGSLAALALDELTQDAILRNLTVLGEAAMRNHKEAPQFVTEHPEAAM